ncbi:hypothetical protein ACTMN8_002426 [Escherichia coli]|uniref:hypothetical protein n=1 Tax=Escherichia coli TaxID=562 RepID=UPI0011DDC3E3|nr:hypothetical protein [Escherichia coli]EAR9475553.1 hypothetical protein [Salmonella enterica]EFB7446737.1 hypothetical protein [Escherichia coli]EFB8787915.1 hypothetical protein [Escherichia coli]EJQ7660552.1 hypothetical protein [Escherichia coli]EKN5779295.1 hypothetical protein [Escherichia coli]
MSKREHTLLSLEEALARILSGDTRRVPPDKKLSVRAVETEAGLSNGSAYYYPGLIERISILKHKSHPSVTISGSVSRTGKWKIKAQEAERLKNKFRAEYIELKQLNAQIAADQYRQMSALQEAIQKIAELEKIIDKLNAELNDPRRGKIKRI